MTVEDEKAFETLWRRIGLSVDWRQRYATIDDHCRRVAQRSFHELHAGGHLYSAYKPTLWDVDYQTAVAQAEVEERPQPGAFHEIAFDLQDSLHDSPSRDRFVVATTRPELLPACVAVAAHPDDARYRPAARSDRPDPALPGPCPDLRQPPGRPRQGNRHPDGVHLRRRDRRHLVARAGPASAQILGRDGRLAPVVFGEGVWQSRDPDAANAAYAALVGKGVSQARTAIVERLRDPTASARAEPRSAAVR